MHCHRSSKDNKSDGQHGRNHSKKQGRVQLHEGSGSRRDNSKRESKMSSLDTYALQICLGLEEWKFVMLVMLVSHDS